MIRNKILFIMDRFRMEAGRFFPLGLVLLLWMLGAVGCEVQVGGLPGQNEAPALPLQLSPREEASLRNQYAQERKEKDDSFRNDPESPLAEKYRADFKGLFYYPIDFRYRFQGRIYRMAQAQRVKMAASDGKARDAMHWGYFRFQADPRTVGTLQVYRMSGSGKDQQDFLFLPFADAHAGKETYGGGRFLDLQEKLDGIYIVDFNRAYNPYCAYGKTYSCPIPPKENRVSLSIPAGERIFIQGEK